jgi:hypothetical protein
VVNTGGARPGWEVRVAIPQPRSIETTRSTRSNWLNTVNAVGDKATGVLANDLQQSFSQQEGALTALSWELFPCIFLAQHAWDIGAVKASAAGLTLPRIRANSAIWATIRRMVRGLAYTGARGTRVRKRLGLRRNMAPSAKIRSPRFYPSSKRVSI